MFKWLQQRFYKKPYEVSIIIPTYDNVEFLIECISSVVASASKCCEYEVLLGIDNCYDTLQFISNEKVFKNSNIRVYYFSKNVGPYIVRNSLASKAKYDNILFFDSDDVMMEDTIKILLSNIKDKDIIKFKFYNFDNEKGRSDLQNLSISSIFSHGAFLIKKSKFFELNGFFGWRCGADAEFVERYQNKKITTVELDIPVYYRRYHCKNITRLPETGLTSKLRKKYEEYVLKNRINQRWDNPTSIQIFHSSKVNV